LPKQERSNTKRANQRVSKEMGWGDLEKGGDKNRVIGWNDVLGERENGSLTKAHSRKKKNRRGGKIKRNPTASFKPNRGFWFLRGAQSQKKLRTKPATQEGNDVAPVAPLLCRGLNNNGQTTKSALQRGKVTILWTE